MSSFAATAPITPIQRGLNPKTTPGGVLAPGIGHHVLSVVTPPIRRSGGEPPARLRISWRKTGFTCRGLWPAYSWTAQLLEREAEEAGRHGLARGGTADGDHLRGVGRGERVRRESEGAGEQSQSKREDRTQHRHQKSTRAGRRLCPG